MFIWLQVILICSSLCKSCLFPRHVHAHTHNLCIRKLGLSQKVRSTPGFTNPWDKEESVWIITRGTTPEAATAQVNWIFLFIFRRGWEKQGEGPLSVSALDLPKADQRQPLLRKHRLGVVVTQSQANPPSPQMECDWGFSSCDLYIHPRESVLPRLWAIPPGDGRVSALVLSWLQRNFAASI